MLRAHGRTPGRSPVQHRLDTDRQTSTHANTHTYRRFRVSTLPALHIFECRRKQQKTHTNVQTAHRKSKGSNLGPLAWNYIRPMVVTFMSTYSRSGILFWTSVGSNMDQLFAWERWPRNEVTIIETTWKHYQLCFHWWSIWLFFSQLINYSTCWFI